MANPHKKKPKQPIPVEPQATKPRKYVFVGPCDYFKIGKLVVDANKMTDEEIDKFIGKYTRLADYFKVVQPEK